VIVINPVLEVGRSSSGFARPFRIVRLPARGSTIRPRCSCSHSRQATIGCSRASRSNCWRPGKQSSSELPQPTRELGRPCGSAEVNLPGRRSPAACGLSRKSWRRPPPFGPGQGVVFRLGRSGITTGQRQTPNVHPSPNTRPASAATSGRRGRARCRSAATPTCRASARWA